MHPHPEFVVLTGLHEGAVAPLRSQASVVGSAADADIVLADPGVEPMHLLVSLGAGLPRVRRRGAAPADDRAGEEEREWPWYEPLAVGAAWVAIVPAGFAWGANLRWPVDGGRDATAAQAEVDPPAPMPPRDRPAWLRRAAVAAALLALAATGLGVVVASTRDQALQSASRGPVVTPHAAAELRRLLAQPGLSQVRLDESVHPPVLKGFVPTRAELGQLAATLAALPGDKPTLQVQAGHELAQRVREFMADPGLQVSYAGAGTVRIAGRAAEPTSRSALAGRVASLRADLGPAVTLDDRIDYPAMPADPVQHPMPLRIVEVQADEPAHFRTADGARWFVGARLPDGAEVLRIEAAQVLFRRGDRTIAFKVMP
jgi:type III secretion protein D